METWPFQLKVSGKASSISIACFGILTCRGPRRGPAPSNPPRHGASSQRQLAEAQPSQWPWDTLGVEVLCQCRNFKEHIQCPEDDSYSHGVQLEGPVPSPEAARLTPSSSLHGRWNCKLRLRAERSRRKAEGPVRPVLCKHVTDVNRQQVRLVLAPLLRAASKRLRDSPAHAAWPRVSSLASTAPESPCQQFVQAVACRGSQAHQLDVFLTR